MSYPAARKRIPDTSATTVQATHQGRTLA